MRTNGGRPASACEGQTKGTLVGRPPASLAIGEVMDTTAGRGRCGFLVDSCAAMGAAGWRLQQVHPSLFPSAFSFCAPVTLFLFFQSMGMYLWHNCYFSSSSRQSLAFLAQLCAAAARPRQRGHSPCLGDVPIELRPASCHPSHERSPAAALGVAPLPPPRAACHRGDARVRPPAPAGAKPPPPGHSRLPHAAHAAGAATGAAAAARPRAVIVQW